MSTAATAAPPRGATTPEAAAPARNHVPGALLLFVVLLLLIPSRLVVGPLGGAGNPATLLGVALLAWWFLARTLPGSGVARGLQPVRVGVACYATAACVSYVLAFHRFLLPSEARAADRALLALAAFAGVACLAADGLHTRAQIERVVRWFVRIGTVVGTVGIVQFFTGLDVRPWYRIPGLTINTTLQGVGERSDFRRVLATGTHPIEFGVLMALVLPLAVHVALHPERPGPAWRRWYPVVVTGCAIPMSLSRSAILGTAAAGVVLLSAWTVRRRVNALVAVAMFTVLMRLMIPGLVGTLRGMFVNLTSDPSYQARVERYPVAFRLAHERPWFGRGFGTLLPENWPGIVPLDNQWLATAIEAGVVGLVALILMMLVGFWTARGAARRIRGHDPAFGHLLNATAAALLAAFVAYPTFDALAYPMVTGSVALLLGVAGAAWRLSRVEVT